MVKTVSIIVPLYNEEENVPLFFNTVNGIVKKINKKYSFDFWFIDDGSSDGSLNAIKKLKSKSVHYVSFSRNFGKESAIYAGLQQSKDYDFTILMDADLQHPPALIPKMFQMIEKNSELDSITPFRTDRKGENKVISYFSRTFYKMIAKISQTNIKNGVGDFRLMKKNMVNAILSLPENQRFSKGIFSWVGFKTDYIPFENQERQLGETKWGFRKLTKYAIEGIVSFSTTPLVFVGFLGVATIILSFLGAILVVVRKLLGVASQFGWASMIVIIMFLSGIQMLSIGIIGRYIASIYLEGKRRPIYIAKEVK